MVKIITLLVSLYVAQVWAMEGVSQATLKNGLKIIVKTDNRAPVFISQLWYKVGASIEKRPLTGVSLMLEHMMFCVNHLIYNSLCLF
jgi:zinc protease